MKVILTLKALGRESFIRRVKGMVAIKVRKVFLILIPKSNGFIERLRWKLHSIAFKVKDRWLSFRYWLRFRDMVSFRQAMKEWAFDRDYPAEDEGRAALHTIDGHTLADGRIAVSEWTNDDLDHGEPNEDAEWLWIAKDRDAFQKRAGRTRTGVSGVQVTVTLDGKRV